VTLQLNTNVLRCDQGEHSSLKEELGVGCVAVVVIEVVVVGVFGSCCKRRNSSRPRSSSISLLISLSASAEIKFDKFQSQIKEPSLRYSK
jgi:hypothetical protein